MRVPVEELSKLSQVEILSRIDYGGFSIVEVPASAVNTLKTAKARFYEEKAAGLIGLQNRPFDIHKGIPAAPKSLTATELSGSPMLYILHFRGPIKSDWVQKIERIGGRIIGYIPENNYLVWTEPSQASKLAKESFVEWKSPYHPEYKIQGKLSGLKGAIDCLSVVVFDDPSGKTIAKIESMGAKFIRKFNIPLSGNISAVNTWFSADASLVNRIARLPKVLYIGETSLNYGLDDAVACQIAAGNYTEGGVPFCHPSYATWLSQIGYNGAGSTVAVVDTGCDTNDPSTVHADLLSRVIGITRYPYTPPTDLTGHGTHVAGIIAGTAAIGTVDDNDFLYGQGMAPGCSLFIQSAVLSGAFPPGDLTGWEEITQDSVQAGAFVSNNSWYSDSTLGMGYTLPCQVFDYLTRDADSDTTGLQPLTFVFSCGNAGPGVGSVYEPKEAKNIITVGASESYRLDSPLGSGCGVSDNIDGVASFSSRGPCKDGRIVPTIVAPGVNITSAVSYSAKDIGNYDNPDYPCKKLIADDYACMSGTSQAAPIVSGALAVIGQWWRSEHNGANPSPAMCKAILVNSAVDMANGPDGRGNGSVLGHIPNGDQGWGRLNLKDALDPPNTYYEDQTQLLTNSGERREYHITPVDPSKPLKITLVWSDAPGTAGSDAAWANDLDLVVTGESGTYVGNDFLGGWSTIGGQRDYKNNVECVYLPNPSGIYSVTVEGANIAFDGVPGNSYSQDQDYALIVRNGAVRNYELQPYAPEIAPGASSATDYKATVATGGWCAIGVRPVTGNDYDLQLFSDSGYTNSVAISAIRGDSIDFVAVNGNKSVSSSVYPRVSPISGTSGFIAEWATRIGDISIGTSSGVSYTSDSVLKTWDIPLSQPASCGVRIVPDTGLDIGVAVVGSTSAPATYYRSRQDSIAAADAAGLGEAESILFDLTAAGRYGLIVWNKSGSGNISINYDTTPPTQPAVTVVSYTTVTDSLSASWQSSDSDTGIIKYEYAIGTSAGATDIAGWTDAGTSTQVTRSGLSLVSGQDYYFTIRATNGAGMTIAGSSTAILAATPLSDISAVKALPDGTGVSLDAKTITGKFLDKFYIEETNRNSGIGVIWGGYVVEGNSVKVIGTLTTVAGERFIEGRVVLNP